MHLVQSPPGKIVDGEILMDGRDLLKLSKSEMEHVNGKDVAMIFQEPMTSLNPVLKVGHQIMESILFHTDATKEEARAKALEMINWLVFRERKKSWNAILTSFPVVCVSVS